MLFVSGILQFYSEEEEIDILENQEDESLHNIYGLDLRNPASLFTLTN